MYRSDLTQRLSASNQPAIRAYQTRPHQHPGRTEKLWDDEAEEFYLKDFPGGVGPQIVREYKILPDEIEEAISRGLVVPEDEMQQAARLRDRQTLEATPVQTRIQVVAQWGVHPNPQRHVGGMVEGYKVTVGGRPAPAIYPTIPERFRDETRFSLEVGRGRSLS